MVANGLRPPTQPDWHIERQDRKQGPVFERFQRKQLRPRRPRALAVVGVFYGSLLAREQSKQVAKPPRVDAVNPIGCGDCLAAGLTWALSDGRPMHDALRIGIAAAAENASQLLPGRLDPRQVGARAETVMIERTDADGT